MKHKVRRIHFVGIGGAGMSGIAEVLLNLGYEVSGSDLAENAATRRLKVEPEIGWRLVAQAAQLDVETVRSAWPYFDYAGTLAADLLDVFLRQEPWIARLQNRVPRTREQLAALIDDSVLREARAD